MLLERTWEIPGDLVIFAATAGEDARHGVIPQRFDQGVIAVINPLLVRLIVGSLELTTTDYSPSSAVRTRRTVAT
jgi:hypothetical protein